MVTEQFCNSSRTILLVLSRYYLNVLEILLFCFRKVTERVNLVVYRILYLNRSKKEIFFLG